MNQMSRPPCVHAPDSASGGNGDDVVIWECMWCRRQILKRKSSFDYPPQPWDGGKCTNQGTGGSHYWVRK